MTTASTERTDVMRPARIGPRPASRAWAASAVGAVLAVVTLVGLPQSAAAKYGSPLVTHVTSAGGRGGAYVTARRDAATARVTVLRAHAQARPDNAGAPQGERRATTRFGSYADLGNGVVLARSARPPSQIACAQSEIMLTERDDRIAAANVSRLDECQCAAGQAHRLRGPPSLSA